MQFIIRRLKGVLIALNGMFILLKSEDSIKTQLFFILFVVIIGICLEITAHEWIIHILLIGFILTAEAFNTVAEKICDLINPKYNHRIKLIKDISAGAVSFAVITSIIILLILYYPYFKHHLN